MSTAISATPTCDPALLSALLAGERFWPTEPQSLADTGLSEPFLEALICKTLLIHGSNYGHRIASELCLPFAIIESILAHLRTQKLIAHQGSGPLNDYRYGLTEEGQKRSRGYYRECAYVGPAPVPLLDYIISVEAQAISDERIRRCDLVDAFHDVSVPANLLDLLGPAVNSGSGLFLYGAPGNGKSTLADRLTSCFGQEIWLPHAFIEGQEIVNLFDPAYHREAAPQGQASGDDNAFDRRWIRIRRPTVVIGGELTMDSLEIRHDPTTNISEAPLQLKSNCGCLLIDDFGRQRVAPQDLLNRWIVPLENRHDFLKLACGKKIQVPFQQLIIFSTNLDPADLVDEAFLRRLPYRIEVHDPGDSEFHALFEMAAERCGCDYDAEAVEYLLEEYYRPQGRPRRRCHPRDLIHQLRNHCTYHDLKLEMRPEYFDKVAESFFASVRTKDLRPQEGCGPESLQQEMRQPEGEQVA